MGCRGRRRIRPLGRGRGRSAGLTLTRSRRLLAAFSRGFHRGSRGHEPPRQRRLLCRRYGWVLGSDFGSDRHRLSPRPLPVAAACSRAIHRAAALRPIRLWLEPVRHRGISGRHRDRRRALCLVTAILLGHIAAVALAHLRVTRLLPGRAVALRAEVPLTALMVAYTVLSLSIIAEPIVERPGASEPSSAAVAVPPDAVIPESGTGRLAPVGPGKQARLKLTYRLLGGAFHDGTRMTSADLLYAYMFAWRWSGPGEVHDPAVAVATAPLRQALVGFRLAGVDTTSKSLRI